MGCEDRQTLQLSAHPKPDLGNDLPPGLAFSSGAAIVVKSSPFPTSILATGANATICNAAAPAVGNMAIR